MPLSEEQATRIRPYVSNLEGGVFALAGLPEEVIAVLFAYYSRSRDDLRQNLARLLSDEELDVARGEGEVAPAFHMASEKARAFHEKWVVGYGHGSVAEHATVHLALEGVSILATKVIEDLRLASYTEKSTRYVLFDEASFCDLPHLPAPMRKRYEDAASGLFRAYLGLIPGVEAEVRRRCARAEGQSERGYDAVVRAKTFDLLRGLLPAGTKTNLGLTANARALEGHLSKMLASPLPEVRAVAGAMHREAMTVAPTLVKYVAASPYRHASPHRSRLPRLPPTAAAVTTPVPPGPPVPRGGGGAHVSTVRLMHLDDDALRRVVLALAYDGADGLAGDAAGLMGRLAAMDDHALEAIVRGALEGRGKFDPAPRAFEAAHMALELTMDFGAYRDMQRHRMVSPFTQRLGCELGAEVPEELDAMGFGEPFRAALAMAKEAHEAIAQAHPWEAQYVVPLAYRVRTLWHLNLRELFHVVELRSSKQGHESYRRVAQDMYREALGRLPWLDGLLRVDLGEYALARS